MCLEISVQLEVFCNKSRVLRELNLSKVYNDLHSLALMLKKTKQTPPWQDLYW